MIHGMPQHEDASTAPVFCGDKMWLSVYIVETEKLKSHLQIALNWLMIVMLCPKLTYRMHAQNDDIHDCLIIKYKNLMCVIYLFISFSLAKRDSALGFPNYSAQSQL